MILKEFRIFKGLVGNDDLLLKKMIWKDLETILLINWEIVNFSIAIVQCSFV